WQQRKLGELAEFSKGAGFSKSDLCEHGRGIILYGQMYTNYQLVIDCISTHVPMNSHGVESRRNDIIVPASGETPEDIATASVVKLDGVLLGGDINVVRLHGNQTDATFIALLLSHGSLHKTLASRAQGKSIVHLHISDIANLHVLKPGITEQSRIAEFFRVLDDLIAAAKK
ncbi:restriction endonuclease subunit S, partial [Bifidobacterium pullorum]|uniref:restriction endonuclease subunit S n=2 Tax=Bifidobacterium TaxID=1678 RepID=UPI0009DFD7AD